MAPTTARPIVQREIDTLLVANRGEIARRIFRTARAMGMRTVAVYSEADRNDMFVADADDAVCIGPAPAAESYLRPDRILDAARRTGADAVHPGYGFLSENAGFAAACRDAGLVFVGPRPEAIEAMGSKLSAKRLLATAGVPVLPDTDDPAAAAARVGFPLLVKPSAGGGGKGMQVVRTESELAGAVDAARRLAAAAFGDDTLLFERYVEAGRHIEIQILADHHGRVIHLGERECSIQRRHQKVLEESPSVVVDQALRDRMGEAAVAAGEAIGYLGAGTVEFLVDTDGVDEHGRPRFYFLEVNTRLQVEHPVTELVTGLDLVRAQLEIAQGGRVPEVPAFNGHAIEVRLNAENPAADFLPQSGHLTRMRIPTGAGIRLDTGVGDGSTISPHYDPMITKVIAHAPTRREAARLLASTLRGAEICGPTTNRDFLVRLLEDPAFLAGELTTRFLERPEAAALTTPLLGTAEVEACAAAAALAGREARLAERGVQPSIPGGWRSGSPQEHRIGYRHRDDELQVGYRFDRQDRLAGLTVNDRAIDQVELVSADPESVDLVFDGVRRRYRVRSDGLLVHVNVRAGQCDLLELDRFPDSAADRAPGSLVAPMPGTVVRVQVAKGDVVEAGQPLLVLEAMKMEHTVTAPAAGLVTVLAVDVGARVDAGETLAEIEAQMPEVSP